MRALCCVWEGNCSILKSNIFSIDLCTLALVYFSAPRWWQNVPQPEIGSNLVAYVEALLHLVLSLKPLHNCSISRALE